MQDVTDVLAGQVVLDQLLLDFRYVSGVQNFVGIVVGKDDLTGGRVQNNDALGDYRQSLKEVFFDLTNQ